MLTSGPMSYIQKGHRKKRGMVLSAVGLVWTVAGQVGFFPEVVTDMHVLQHGTGGSREGTF